MTAETDGTELSGTGDHSGGPEGNPADLYDETYYETYGAKDESGAHIERPYRRGTNWDTFFGHLADCIVDRLRPATALDVGCAIGILVEALRNRGVDARGFDVSEWAISQVPEPLRPFCWVGSLDQEIEGHYDLITCIEVIEHLPASMAADAIANICRHTDTVLFSSTPDDFEEPTHLNVQPPDYWVALFADRGFFRDLRHDASYLVPHAFLLRRRDWSHSELAEQYDRAWWQARQTLLGVQSIRERLEAELEQSRQGLESLRPELEDAIAARRRAESDLLGLQKQHERLLDDLAAAQGDGDDEDGGPRPWWLGQQAFIGLQASRDRYALELEEAWRTLAAVRAELEDSEDQKRRTEDELALARRNLHDLQAQLQTEASAVTRLQETTAELERLHNTKVMRYSGSMRRVYAKMRQRFGI